MEARRLMDASAGPLQTTNTNKKLKAPGEAGAAAEKVPPSAAASPQEPLPLPGLSLPTAAYQRIWARPSDDVGSPQFVDALLAPGKERCYIKKRDLSPAGANPKPLYLCSELVLDAEGVFVPSERGTVVIKAARLQSNDELKSVTAGLSVGARREGGDEPAEEAKTASLLTKALEGKEGPAPVVPLLDCFVDGDHWLYMVLPFYCGGDLVDSLGKLARQGELGSPSSVRWARAIFGRLIGSLSLLKEQGIAHLDISPENAFLLDETGTVPALGDFGMALRVPATKTAGRSKSKVDVDDDVPRTPAKAKALNGARKKKWEPGDVESEEQPAALLTAQRFRGKIAYAAPELLTEQPFDPHAADVFSLGCTLFALLAGRLLLEPSSAKPKDAGRPRFAALLRRDFHVLLELHNSSFQLPPQAAELIRGMVEPDPRKRMTLEEIKAHPWVVQGV